MVIGNVNKTIRANNDCRNKCNAQKLLIKKTDAKLEKQLIHITTMN